MSPWFGFLILGAVTSLVEAQTYALPYKANGQCRNGTTEYKSVDGYCCSKCHPGTKKGRDCTSTTDTVCEKCSDGMYSENMNYYHNCFLCTTCQDSGMDYAKRCSRDSDAVCMCKPGWFCENSNGDSCTACQKYRTCGPGKGAKTSGTSTEDIQCAKCSPGTFSNETGTGPCQPHTRCDLQGRTIEVEGTPTTDTVCGPFASPVTKHISTSTSISTPKTTSSPMEPSTPHPTRDPQSATLNTSAVISKPAPYSVFPDLWIGLAVATLLMLLLMAGFCIYHRKARNKPPVHHAVEVGQCLHSAHISSPNEIQGLLADSGSDPSTSSSSSSSSSDSQSQGTGVSQDCLHAEQPSVSSPVVNLSITATFNCQVNSTTGTCSIPISPCMHLSEPEFPLSQEEELCVPCEQEDSKDAIQSVQESGLILKTRGKSAGLITH